MANKLKQWRENQRTEDGKPLTQKALGMRIGVGQQTVDRYERGLRIPEPDKMLAIFEVTGGEVQPNDFYGLEAIAS